MRHLSTCTASGRTVDHLRAFVREQIEDRETIDYSRAHMYAPHCQEISR
jgi:hypothetical protein